MQYISKEVDLLHYTSCLFRYPIPWGFCVILDATSSTLAQHYRANRVSCKQIRLLLNVFRSQAFCILIQAQLQIKYISFVDI